jgi:hypothetical protein
MLCNEIYHDYEICVFSAYKTVSGVNGPLVILDGVKVGSSVLAAVPLVAVPASKPFFSMPLQA